MNTQLTEKQMRATYKLAFGQEFDDPKRKQHPLPIDMAYEVALLHISKKTKTSHDSEICPVYNEVIFADEDGNCSLCGGRIEDLTQEGK